MLITVKCVSGRLSVMRPVPDASVIDLCGDQPDKGGLLISIVQLGYRGSASFKNIPKIPFPKVESAFGPRPTSPLARFPFHVGL